MENWKRFFCWVPHWVPFIGSSSTQKIEMTIGCFNQMKQELKSHIQQGHAEISMSMGKVNKYEEKIKAEKTKQEERTKSIKKAHTIIGNIDAFMGEA